MVVREILRGVLAFGFWEHTQMMLCQELVLEAPWEVAQAACLLFWQQFLGEATQWTSFRSSILGQTAREPRQWIWRALMIFLCSGSLLLESFRKSSR